MWIMHLADIALLVILFFTIIVLLTMLTNLWLLVPYVPTSRSVIKRMIQLAEIQGNETVYDLGCGDARILIAAKRQYPGIAAIGYELSPGVWMLAKLRVFFSRLKMRVFMRDFRKANFSDANIVFLYLFPEVMPGLKKKFDAELPKGARVISNGFPFREKDPLHTERVPLPSWHIMRPPKHEGPQVFVYEW